MSGHVLNAKLPPIFGLCYSAAGTVFAFVKMCLICILAGLPTYLPIDAQV